MQTSVKTYLNIHCHMFVIGHIYIIAVYIDPYSYIYPQAAQAALK